MQQSLKINNVCSQSWAEQLAHWLISTQRHTLASQRAPVGLPVGIGVFGLGINWLPAGVTDTEGLHQWTEPGGEASSCCGSFGFTSNTHTHTHGGHTDTNYTKNLNILLPNCGYSHAHPPSHTPLLSPLNSVWWPSILQLGFSAWGGGESGRQ